MHLKAVISKNSYFFIPYLAVLLFAAIPLVCCSKSSVHIFINSYHSPFCDSFYKYTTNLGDGFFAVAVGILFLFVSFRKSFFVLFTYIGGGLFAQLLKRLLFPGFNRPAMFFQGGYDLHLVTGIKMKHYFSFPSGHAATAFGLFLCLAIMSRKNTTKVTCLIIATIVAFSRVSLSQHFLVDAYFGSMIGVAAALVFYRVIYLSEKKWMDNNLLLMKKKG